MSKFDDLLLKFRKIVREEIQMALADLNDDDKKLLLDEGAVHEATHIKKRRKSNLPEDMRQKIKSGVRQLDDNYFDTDDNVDDDIDDVDLDDIDNYIEDDRGRKSRVNKKVVESYSKKDYSKLFE